MGSLRRHEGWLYVDQGIGPDLNRHGTTELPTFTCCHCNGVVIMNVRRTRPRGYCAKCDHWTCDHVVCATECNPIKRDLALAQHHPDANQPFLLRGPRGEVLYDSRFKDEERIY
jgi:hypothetical protein